MAAADLELGRVARPHGIRGEVVVMLHTDRPERTTPGAVLRAGDRTPVSYTHLTLPTILRV